MASVYFLTEVKSLVAIYWSNFVVRRELSCFREALGISRDSRQQWRTMGFVIVWLPKVTFLVTHRAMFFVSAEPVLLLVLYPFFPLVTHWFPLSSVSIWVLVSKEGVEPADSYEAWKVFDFVGEGTLIRVLHPALHNLSIWWDDKPFFFDIFAKFPDVIICVFVPQTCTFCHLTKCALMFSIELTLAKQKGIHISGAKCNCIFDVYCLLLHCVFLMCS